MSDHDDETLVDAAQEDAPALPEDDLEHYTGRWVAVRDGKVVAHEADLESLQENPAVRASDDMFPVGDPPSGFYTLSA